MDKKEKGKKEVGDFMFLHSVYRLSDFWYIC